ncbi:MAG: hypothetical protein HY680_06215, partial [Chloroflexi bacterium]|nr:hypothetical protein [Chloroflexota bacterium]
MNKHPGISTVILTEVGAAWKERPWWPSLAGGAFFVLVWWLRGGLTEALPNHPWPWPAGTVRTGWTSEPYILVSLGPDWLLTFSLFSTFQFLVLAALAGGTLALTLRARTCSVPGQPTGMAGSLSPALLAALGGTGCCLPLTPLLLSLGGVAAALKYFDGLALGLFACSWLVLTRRLRPSLTEPHALPAWVLTAGMRTLQVAAAVAAARALLRLWP